ncbi:MAG TPA: RidA family protein [Burkholderiales bacterium]|nr:RidA family protein [Burkholderiales bacterium]
MNRMLNVGVAARVGTYSDAVEIAPGKRVLYVSGTPGLSAETGQLPESFVDQADLAWRNVKAILAEAGMSVEDIVKLTQYLIRRDDLAAYRDIRSRHLGACRPASMLAFLPELVWPKMLIELEVVAAK